MDIRVTVWNENRVNEKTRGMYEVYPEGIHGRLREIFEGAGFSVTTALLDEPECCLTEAVNRGMGFIPLHSAHMAKPFVRLMGTTCTLSWRESHDRELLWSVCPGHPIAEGIPPVTELLPEEMYGEYYDIPAPEETVFTSWFSGGEVFRSGVCYRRGRGRIFYFQPGHETYPTYYVPEIERILVNAVRWAAPAYREESTRTCRYVEPLVSSREEDGHGRL